jgi:hypothetical protein
MQANQGNTLQALRAIDDFIDKNASELPSVVAPAVGQAKLKAQLVQFTARAFIQDGSQRSMRGLTQRQQELKAILLDDHMEPIRRAARADLPHTPELKQLTVVKRGATFARLVMSAEGMAAAAIPFADILIAGGMAPNFIDALKTAAQDLSDAMDERVTVRAETGGATKSLVTMNAAARRTIHVLDALVKKDLKTKPELLNQWNMIRRPRKVTVQPATTPATPATAPTPAAPVTPAAPPTPALAAATQAPEVTKPAA